MKSLFKRIVTLALACFMASSLLLTSQAAAPLKNIFFSPADTDIYEHEIGGSKNMSNVNNQNIIFTDGNNYMVYKLPLEKTATIATVVLDVSQNYMTWISADGKTFDQPQFDPSLTGVAGCSNANRTEICYDVTSFIPNGEVYVKIGDQTVGNGWGAVIWSIRLVYAKYEAEVILPFTKAGVDYSFYPGTKQEKAVMHKAGGELSGSSAMRFVDGAVTVIYKLPIDVSKKSWLNFVVAANFVVRISIDDSKYVMVAAAENGKNAVGYGSENRAMHSIDLQKYMQKNFPGQNPDFFYFKLADQSTGNGWGGQISYLGIHYGNKNNLYNPITTKASTLVRYKRPQRVTQKIKTYRQELVKRDEPEYTEYEDPDETDESVEEVSEEIISSEESSQEVSSQAVEENKQEEKKTPDSYLWYIILGSLAVLLVGGAVTQFIIMERKRKLTKTDKPE